MRTRLQSVLRMISHSFKPKKLGGRISKLRILISLLACCLIIAALCFVTGVANPALNPVGSTIDSRTATGLYQRAQKIIAAEPGVPGQGGGVVCGNFITATMPKDTTDIAGVSESNAPGAYATHRRGKQCFSVGMVAAGVYGVTIVLDGNETPPPTKTSTDNITGLQLVALFNHYYLAQAQLLGVQPAQPIAEYCSSDGGIMVSNSNKPVYHCVVATGTPPTTDGSGGTSNDGNITSNIPAGQAVMQQYTALVTQQGFSTAGYPNNTDQLNNASERYFEYDGSLSTSNSHGCGVQASYYPDWINNNTVLSLSCDAYITSVPVGFTKIDANI